MKKLQETSEIIIQEQQCRKQTELSLTQINSKVTELNSELKKISAKTAKFPTKLLKKQQTTSMAGSRINASRLGEDSIDSKASRDPTKFRNKLQLQDKINTGRRSTTSSQANKNFEQHSQASVTSDKKSTSKFVNQDYANDTRQKSFKTGTDQ